MQNLMMTQLEIADFTMRVEAKKKQIEQFRNNLNLLERRIDEMLKRINR